MNRLSKFILTKMGLKPCLVCQKFSREDFCSVACYLLYEEAMEASNCCERENGRCIYHDAIPEEGGCQLSDDFNFFPED